MSAPAGQAPPRFTEESAIVIDKWLYDVCGDEDMQFPSHRRAQFVPYMKRARHVSKQKSFMAETFAYPSRSGTREVLVLQNMLEALGWKERHFLQRMQQVDESIARVRQVSAERTMGASTSSRSGGEAPTQDNMASSSTTDPTANGYAAFGGATSDAEAQYEQRRSIAERCTAELRKKTADMQRQRTELDARHAALLEEKVQLEKEFEALKLTEEMVAERHTQAERLCAEEQQQLEAETRAWEASHPDLKHVTGSSSQAETAAEDEVDRSLSHHSEGDETVAAVQSNLPSSSEDGERTLPATTHVDPQPQPRDGDSDATLEKLRAELSEAGAAALELKRQMKNEEHVHSGRFRQAQQKLRDWQEMVAALRHTVHQLRGQTKVISTVITDTAARLEESTSPSYLAQFYRANALLMERSSEKMKGLWGDSSEQNDLGQSAYTVDVRPLARPAPTPGCSNNVSAVNTPMRGGSAPSGSLTETPPRRAASIVTTTSATQSPMKQQLGGGAADRHRSRYDLVRHLQRWESALQVDRAEIVRAAGLEVSERATGENRVPEQSSPMTDSSVDARNAKMRQRFIQVRKLLCKE